MCRATAATIRANQSAQRVHLTLVERAPRHSESDSTHPKNVEGSLCVLKMRTAPQPSTYSKRCDCHEICAQARITAPAAKLKQMVESAAPVTQSKLATIQNLPNCCACHEIHLEHVYDTRACVCASVIFVGPAVQSACFGEPEMRQNWLRSCWRHSPVLVLDAAKQDISKRPPLKRKPHWPGNANTQPSKALRLRSKTASRACEATIPAPGQ